MLYSKELFLNIIITANKIFVKTYFLFFLVKQIVLILLMLFQVWPNDGLPAQICSRCASKLYIAFQLKKQCESSDTKLRLYQAAMPSEEKVVDESQPSETSKNNDVSDKVLSRNNN